MHEVPFSSETKRMTTIHAVNGNLIAYAKGAPEVILESCDRVLNATVKRSSMRPGASKFCPGADDGGRCVARAGHRGQSGDVPRRALSAA
jgi:magnesium-transporting ATPase (P-type)